MAWYIPSIVVGFLLGLGALGASVGALGPAQGFQTFLSGLFVAAISALGLGGASAFAAATGKPWRSRAVRGAALPLAVVVTVLIGALGSGAPPIHDITTDPDDTLAFTPDVAGIRPEEPRQAVLEKQREAYGDLAPLRVTESPEEAFARALETASGMPRWTVTAAHPEAGRIEALAESRIFRFRDDVVIRVQPDQGGSRIDVRSRSRFGQGDLGTNAARIRAFLAAYRGS